MAESTSKCFGYNFFSYHCLQLFHTSKTLVLAGYIHTYIHTYIHYVTLHTLRYVKLRYITLNYVTLRYVKLR